MNQREAASPICVLAVSEFPLVGWALEQLVAARNPRMRAGGVAKDVIEAKTLLATGVHDVVVVDIDGEAGLTAVEALQGRTRGRILALTEGRDLALHDAAVLAGACGVVRKTEPVEVLLKAIECVHGGEIWVDRQAAGRIFFELARRKKIEQEADPDAAKIALLTRKERLTVAEVARDASATPRQIADRLHISENTLRNHLTSIYAKLGLGNRLELHTYAQRHALLVQ